MQRGAKPRNRAELTSISIRASLNPILDGKKTVETPPLGNLRRKRPGHDHLVTHIGVHLAAVGDNRLLNVEEEARQKVLHAHLTPRLGQGRRGWGVEAQIAPG